MDSKPVETPKGRPATLWYREDTSDLATIGAIWRLWGSLEDEYHLADLPDDMSGTAVDIGAHIGAVSMALLLDHPRLRVVAVEPLEGNVEVLRRNAEALGVADRLTVHAAAIAVGDTASVTWNWDTPINEGYWRNNRYIGGVLKDTPDGIPHSIATVPGVSLGSLLPRRGRVPFMKIDCEGCEWVALADPAIRRVERIAGEYHGGPGPDDLARLLGDSHDITTKPIGGHGMFWAVRR